MISMKPLTRGIRSVFAGGSSGEVLFEELEELLILSDISTSLAARMIENVRKKSGFSLREETVIDLLKEEIAAIFQKVPSPSNRPPRVVMLVGINGSGKTTQAAKLGWYYRNRFQGKVLFSAADTFRAAGSTQLGIWGDHLSIPVIGGNRGADAGSVVYNSMQSFRSRDYDTMIIDTAGRVQTRDSLMKELGKLLHIIHKFDADQPDEVYLVVDATTGQNTLEQARRFRDFAGLTGLILAKTDGTARGGTVVNIVNEMSLPVRFTGFGEKETDLRPFDPDHFVKELFAP